jgi:hypothetical protein
MATWERGVSKKQKKCRRLLWIVPYRNGPLKILLIDELLIKHRCSSSAVRQGQPEKEA